MTPQRPQTLDEAMQARVRCAGEREEPADLEAHAADVRAFVEALRGVTVSEAHCPGCRENAEEIEAMERTEQE